MAVPKPSGTDISIYAELLPNIGQVSVAAALPSPSDATTSAVVLDGGRRLRVGHGGRSEVLELPVAVAASAPLALPSEASAELGWRLRASPAEASALRLAPEDQAIPWSSSDLRDGSPVCCRQCFGVIVPRGRVKTWKDLPSENWAEMMEFWHCHKPHDLGQHDEALANRGYGANSAMTAQPGVGLIDITLFMLSESDCDSLLFLSSTGATFSTSALAMDEAFSGKNLGIVCGRCRADVGLYSTRALSVTLFKWQVTCETTSPTRALPSVPECLASALLAAISRSGCAKSVIIPYVPGRGRDATRLPHLWVLNANVVYASSAVEGKRAAMKVLYREVDADEGNKLVGSVASDVQDISMPTGAMEAAWEALQASSLLLPERERTFQGWNSGLLERWSLET